MTEAALDLPPAPVRPQPIVDMAEPSRFASERRIVAAESSGGAITIAWDDGSSVRLHPLWLRSECACAECRDRVTLERTFDQFRLPPDLAALQVEVTAAGALRLVWSPGGHVSLFDPGWLHRNARGQGPESTGRGTPRLWRAADLAGAIPTFEHDAIMRDAHALHGWLTALRDVGLTLLSGVPAAEREVERIARRISLPRDSNFGAVFDVMTMANANSNAYTAIELPPHVDLPTREYQPGFQFFHCLDNQAKGGESTYVDGFAVAEHLRAEEPEIFRHLTETPVGFRFCDAVSDYVWHAPTLVLDEHRALREVRFIPWLMAPLAAEPDRFEFDLWRAAALCGADPRPALPVPPEAHRRHDGGVRQPPHPARPRRLRARERAAPFPGLLHRTRGGREPHPRARARASGAPAMSTTVGFTRMDRGTAEDYALLGRRWREHQAGLADNLLGILKQMAGDPLGYRIDRYQHSLQTATRAQRDGADAETVVCALLHDIGDVLAPANHSQVSAAILRPYVGDRNYWVIQHHGLFQGYYYFHHAGQDRHARDAFRDHPHYQACVDFCARWDQLSFDPDYDTLPLDFFEPMVRGLCSREPRDFA